MYYTSQGYMTSADLEALRRDMDWDELNPDEVIDDSCVHARLLTDDCDECARY